MYKILITERAVIDVKKLDLVTKKRIGEKMKKLLSIVILLSMTFLMLTGEVKIINVPEKVTVETDGFNEVFVRNLAEEGLFRIFGIALLDDHIFILNAKPVGLYKLDLQGKTIGKAGRPGEGPGEFRDPVTLKKFRGKLLCLDFFTKIVFYDRELKFLKEKKFPTVFMDLAENNEGKIILPFRQVSQTDKYFVLYSKDLKLLRHFGNRQVQKKQKKMSKDFVFNLAYDPENDGIWAAFGDRYDLSYYEEEKLKVEIREKNGCYKSIKVKDKKTGIMETVITGRPIKLDIIKEKIYYFYRKDKDLFCDIFNKNSCKLMRRIKFERFYRRIAHHKNGIFYAIYSGLENDEDYQLCRLELK